MKKSLIVAGLVLGLSTFASANVTKEEKMLIENTIKKMPQFERLYSAEVNGKIDILGSGKINKTDKMVKILIQADAEVPTENGQNKTIKLREIADLALLDGGKHIVFGLGVDTSNGEDSIGFDKQKLEKEMLSGKDSFISFGDKTKEKVLIFTDPDCPYCQQLDDLIENQKLSDKYEFHVYLTPLDRLHPNAEDKALIAMSKTTVEDKKATLKSLRGVSSKAENIKEEVKQQLIKNRFYGNIMGVNSTPTIFVEKDGKLERLVDYTKLVK